mmetsp:Transcript_65967/g.208820  ORF Transcript_65967/g.208820 Transcript_65967/m.208820 type:complete len:166 (+) Transcript_65967:126-623(+)|eukprot:CAMPEP_0182912174 /NCGR_PEP_ID=MMETSP0034_2-20130328/37373_1 /TAXON_ID=156128 /ORGANISM="Nephroselmis pyriformis, Strain CCMP717" /LENGTH=165 /DNA_ID=CAMNT_0025048827 /DNA_START=75 /DNA_END=572 /DNA_ORIENTATION=-
MAFFLPPLSYGMVEDELYRSGEPNDLNFPFLERLKLKTVIFLGHDEPSQQLLNFLDDQDIELFRPPGWDEQNANPASPISEAEVLAALEAILTPSRYPLWIMSKGAQRTGTVIGCLRKLQRWSLTAILEEYRRYAGNKVRLLNEQFIELFDTDLVSIPVDHPRWL